MGQIASLLSVSLGAVLVNNILFSRLLGLRLLIDTPQKPEAAAKMGAAVTLVMGFASAVAWILNHMFLKPFELQYLQMLVFLLVIVPLVQLLGYFMKCRMVKLYEAVGKQLPIIAVDCSVLGVMLLGAQNQYGFFASIIFGIACGLGFLLVVVVFSGIQERLAFADCPKSWKGFPIALVAAGLMTLAMQGFYGLRIW